MERINSGPRKVAVSNKVEHTTYVEAQPAIEDDKLGSMMPDEKRQGRTLIFPWIRSRSQERVRQKTQGQLSNVFPTEPMFLARVYFSPKEDLRLPKSSQQQRRLCFFGRERIRVVVCDVAHFTYSITNGPNQLEAW
jgi:hypothetical protein